MRVRFVLAIAFAATSASAAPAPAPMKTYRWTDATCENTVRYDPRKVDGAALASTAEILNNGDERVPSPPLVDKPSDIAKLDPDGWEKGCRAKAAAMRAATLLPLPGLEDFRAERARHIDDACLFGAAKMRGYAQPSALRGYPLASPKCDIYVDALEGKTDMTALWRARIAADCRDNASPAACIRRDEERGNGPDGEAWKRLYLTGYSWNNCAIERTDFNREDNDRRTARWDKLSQAFRKAYGVRRGSCDRP